MTFVFPVLLGGLALIGIPVLIHLILRKKPKIEPFPAFRFLLQRQRINVRKLRLRHLLLLALRILLIACIVLALTRPQVVLRSFSLRGDQPIAVVMIFDTSFTMQYKSNQGVSRLDQAKIDGLELIDGLPSGSRVAILDTADAAGGGTPWYQSMNEARERIGKLHWKPANAPVSRRLENAYRLLAELASTKDDERARHLPRLVLIFSDRTRSSWDPLGDADMSDTSAASGKGNSRYRRVQNAADQIPPVLSGLHQARDNVPALIELLGQFRDRLELEPQKSYPQQDLLGSLAILNEVLAHVTVDDLTPGSEVIKTIDNVRRPAREMIAALGDMKVSEAETEYHEKLLTSLYKLLDDLAGARAYFIDVGIDRPIDLTLLALDLPSSEGQTRQVFNENSRIRLLARVQATGKDASTTLTLQVGARSWPRNLDIKAGAPLDVPFDLESKDLGVGQHSAEVKLATEDSLPGNNSRFVTFGVRPALRILVLSDDPERSKELAKMFASLVDFVAEVARPQDQPALSFVVSYIYKTNKEGDLELVRTPPDPQRSSLQGYHAVFLDGLANPPESLWLSLQDYVRKGGGVAVIPSGADMNLKAYNQGPAQTLLPGTWEKLITNEEKPAKWNLSHAAAFQHRLTRPFAEWNEKKLGYDIVLRPRSATRYWEVKERNPDMVLLKYDDGRERPALLERLASQQDRPGKVLMFTTTLGPPPPESPESEKMKDPRWNNYLEATTTFFAVLIGKTTDYLADEDERAQLNFVCGQGEFPTVRLPPHARFAEYQLKGPDLDEKVVLPTGDNNLVLKQAIYPGNYSLSSLPPNEGKFTARFSLNLPADESNLTRLPVSDLESVLGKGRVLAGPDSTSLHDVMQGTWSEPVELLPTLLMVLLLALAVENLLANRFYNTDWAGFFRRAVFWRRDRQVQN